jgi:hypothetical protein
MGGPTASSTVNISVSLNAGEGCSLSATVPLTAILETGELPPRYFLTPHACNNILQEAERRGRKLPELLKKALKNVVRSRSNPASEGVVAGSRRRLCRHWPEAMPVRHPIRDHVSRSSIEKPAITSFVG